MPDAGLAMIGTVVFNLGSAIALIREANRVRDGGDNETVTRQTLVSALADTFPVDIRPWWVTAHILGAEQRLAFAQGGAERRGYGDSVVGLSAIEYEKDLRVAQLFNTGKHQVRQYCTGLLNEGADRSRVRGILSDGVEWRAFEVAAAVPGADGTSYDVENVVLGQIDRISCDVADQVHAEGLISFLTRHLGREGTRPLTGPSLAAYVGFDSGIGSSRVRTLDARVRDLTARYQDAASLVQDVWSQFVRYLSVEQDAPFDTTAYVQEFYLALLARLICANVIVRRPLRSDDAELDGILNGRLFEAKGLHRLVEYDYFGWMTTPGRIDSIRPVARDLQRDLAAFDFDSLASEDVFGGLLSALAERTHRSLLGQEWTPAWLADLMAADMFSRLPSWQSPRFVDMCCGSGAMLVAVTKLARTRLAASGIPAGSQEAVDYLVQSATGFDIDPVAVTLAKVNWVVANRDWLEPFDGSRRVSLPVYHADSLFALSPIFATRRDNTAHPASYELVLIDERLLLPKFLVEPRLQALFDALVEGAYFLVSHASESGQAPARPSAARVVDDAVSAVGAHLSDTERDAAVDFGLEFATKMASLQRRGKNGIWSFVIRNSFRPSLLAGQFNGLISNPPWLALSRMRHNPFGPVLSERASVHRLTPPGAAFLHLEMATTFFAHAIDRYLAEGAVVACILPDTIRNGSQHLPFRVQVSGRDPEGSTVRFRLAELLMVDAGVFRNRAVVVLGSKGDPTPLARIPGRLVSRGSSTAIAHHLAVFGDRVVWSPNPPGSGVPGGYLAGFAQQGADLMPRRLVMVAASAVTTSRVTIRTPDQGGPDWYLVGGAKNNLAFSLVPRTLPARFVQHCLMSKHVAPFVISEPGHVVLPIVRSGVAPRWRRATGDEMASSPEVVDHFADVIRESDYASLDDFWVSRLDYRAKLTLELLPSDAWLIVYGAGGGIPAAAFAPVARFADQPPVIDQTLYWMTTRDPDEAAYLAGLLNSEPLLARIADFIPEGDFGDRHLHTLPSRAIPEFDLADPAHVRVAVAARALASEVEGLRAIGGNAAVFDPASSLQARRRSVRRLMRTLPSFAEYDTACAAVYESFATQGD
jgi:N-6 DNA Methylase